MRKSIGYTQAQLAQALCVAQSNVGKWETGRLKPPGAVCVTLSKLAAEEDRGWWLGLVGIKPDQDREASEGRVRRIPLLRDAAAAGTPRAIDETEIEETLLFPKRFLPPGGSLYAIKVVGDSMFPVLQDGYIAVVDVASRTIARLSNRMVAAREGDGVTIKWLRRQTDDLYLLVPEHPSDRNPIRVLQQGGDYSIVGEVIRWIGQPPTPKRK